MKMRILSLILAGFIFSSVIHTGMFSTGALINSAYAGSTNDGVDIAALMNSNIYYGKYKHATSLLSGTYGAPTKEAIATPVLWKVMGEEQTNDKIGATDNTLGDGYFTLLSNYVLDSTEFSKGTAITTAYITSQPANKSIKINQTASFSVSVSGAAVTSYQWQVNTGNGFVNVSDGSGQTSATYTTPSVTIAHDGYKYRCVVNGGITSESANLSVAASLAPIISTHPGNIFKYDGQSAVFSVLGTGTSLTYQWKVSKDNGGNYTDIDGEKKSTYTIPMVTNNDNNNKYICVVTNTTGSATSMAATLSVSDTFAATPVFCSSGVRDFINNNFNDSNAFNKAEYSSIPLANVVNRYINVSNRIERVVTDYSGFYWPNTVKQKVYLPSVLNMSNLTNKFTWGASEALVKDIAGNNGATIDVKNSLDTTTNFALGKCKGATSQYVNYWAGNIYGSGISFGTLVNGGKDLTSFSSAGANATNGSKNGIRPVFKLDPQRIIYAEKITAVGNGYEVGIQGKGDNYKLTLSQDDNGLLNLSNLKDDGELITDNQMISASPNTALNLTGSISFASNNVMYKIVDYKSEIVGYGEASVSGSTNQSILIPTSNLLGRYDLYLWEQQSNVDQSDVGSKPIHLGLSVQNDTGTVKTNAATPLIKTQPVAPSSSIGRQDVVNLSVIASIRDKLTGGEISYQWYMNTNESYIDGTALSNGNLSNYSTTSGMPYGTYYYYCKVINTNLNVDGDKISSINSNIVKVVVDKVNAATPIILYEPTTIPKIDVGKTTTLTVSASISDSTQGGVLSYQWFKNTNDSTQGGVSVGTNSSSYTTEAAPEAGKYYYYCELTNTNNGSHIDGQKIVTIVGKVYTVTVEVFKVATPTIISQPAKMRTIPLGKSIKLSLFATASDTEKDGGKITYKWFKNSIYSYEGAQLVGTDSSELMTGGLSEGTYYYFCEVTNTNNTVSGNKIITVVSRISTIVVSQDANPIPDNLLVNSGFQDSDMSYWNLSGAKTIVDVETGTYFDDYIAYNSKNKSLKMETGSSFFQEVKNLEPYTKYNLKYILLGANINACLLVEVIDGNGTKLFVDKPSSLDKSAYYKLCNYDFETQDSDSIIVKFTWINNVTGAPTKLNLDVIELFEGEASANIALGKRVDDSFGYIDSMPNRQHPYDAIDGRADTSAAYDSAVYKNNILIDDVLVPNPVQPFIIVDLGEKSIIESLYVRTYVGGALSCFKFLVETSDDLVNWRTIWDTTEDDVKSTIYKTVIDTKCIARFVRIKRDSRSDDVQFNLCEFEIFGKEFIEYPYLKTNVITDDQSSFSNSDWISGRDISFPLYEGYYETPCLKITGSNGEANATLEDLKTNNPYQIRGMLKMAGLDDKAKLTVLSGNTPLASMNLDASNISFSPFEMKFKNTSNSQLTMKIEKTDGNSSIWIDNIKLYEGGDGINKATIPVDTTLDHSFYLEPVKVVTDCNNEEPYISFIKDQKFNTNWEAKSHEGSHTIVYDFGQSVNIVGSRLIMYTYNYIYKYRILASHDGVAYTTVLDKTNNITRLDATKVLTDSFKPKARYIKLIIEDVYPKLDKLEIGEFAVYSSSYVQTVVPIEPPPIEPPPTEPAPTEPTPTEPTPTEPTGPTKVDPVAPEILKIKLSGVLSYSNGKPMGNVKLKIQKSLKETVTDKSGYFNFDEVIQEDQLLTINDANGTELSRLPLKLTKGFIELNNSQYEIKDATKQISLNLKYDGKNAELVEMKDWDYYPEGNIVSYMKPVDYKKVIPPDTYINNTPESINKMLVLIFSVIPSLLLISFIVILVYKRIKMKKKN